MCIRDSIRTPQSALLLLNMGLAGEADAFLELARNVEMPDAVEVRSIASRDLALLSRKVLSLNNDTALASGFRLLVALGERQHLTRLETLALTSPLPRARGIGMEALGMHGDHHTLGRLEETFFGRKRLVGRHSEADRLAMARTILQLVKAIKPEEAPAPRPY